MWDFCEKGVCALREICRVVAHCVTHVHLPDLVTTRADGFSRGTHAFTIIPHSLSLLSSGEQSARRPISLVVKTHFLETN